MVYIYSWKPRYINIHIVQKRKESGAQQRSNKYIELKLFNTKYVQVVTRVSKLYGNE